MFYWMLVSNKFKKELDKELREHYGPPTENTVACFEWGTDKTWTVKLLPLLLKAKDRLVVELPDGRKRTILFSKR